MNGSRPVALSALVALLLMAAGRTAFAKTIKVPGDKPTIQKAIDAAVKGDVVVVAMGTHKENIDFRGKAITVRSTNPTDKTVVALTVIDGNQNGHVVTFQSGEKATSVLTGFTITNGTGDYDDSADDIVGGGVFCNGSSPTLTNNIISGNSAGDDLNGGRGGGVYCWGCSPILTNNTIGGNSAGHGGGLWCDYSSPTLTNNIISGNSSNGSLGGGVGCEGGSPVLTNNTISGNRADDGGGVYCANGSSPILTNNTISYNSATWGGGVSCFRSSPILTNNTISGNKAWEGGGVYCEYQSSPAIKNTTIAFSTKGGGLYVDVTNYPSKPAKPVITYCDFWKNTGGDYVHWPKQTGKKGNISKDPLFANAAAGDFHEKSKGGRWNPKTKAWVKDTVQSPCINAGDPKSAFANEPKPNGGRINMGAYGNTPQASKSAPAAAAAGLVLTATAASTGSGLAQVTVNLTSAASVQVRVLNLAGREVAVLPPQDLPEGLGTVLWDGRSTSGTKAPSGRYLVRVTARGQDGSQAQALAGSSLGR